MHGPSKKPAGAPATPKPLQRQAVRTPHQFKPVVAQRKTVQSAQSVRPLAPPPYRPRIIPVAQAKAVGRSPVPQSRPASQFKPAVAQLKNSPLKTNPGAPAVYRPQPLPKVLQKKPSTLSRPQTTLQLKATQTPTMSPRTPLNSQLRSRTSSPAGGAKFGVIQRASRPFTRSQADKVEALAEDKKESKDNWAGAAATWGYDWNEMNESEKKAFQLMIMNLPRQSRSKRPPEKKGAGQPFLEKFTYGGESKFGLNPGGAYYAEIIIKYSGSRTLDFLYADMQLLASGNVRPANTVWHHYHDYGKRGPNMGTMYLMSIADHSTPHHGGMWQYNKSH